MCATQAGDTFHTSVVDPLADSHSAGVQCAGHVAAKGVLLCFVLDPKFWVRVTMRWLLSLGCCKHRDTTPSPQAKHDHMVVDVTRSSILCVRHEGERAHHALQDE